MPRELMEVSERRKGASAANEFLRNIKAKVNLINLNFIIIDKIIFEVFFIFASGSLLLSHEYILNFLRTPGL